MDQRSEVRLLVFQFRGSAREYFGIWIVNLLLSIITVGIYTAWAKVRRLRYFYGNTFLDGHNFEYHARPVQILVGRIIVVAVLLAYNGLVALHPAFSILLVPYLAGLPWLINKAMSFNAHMTSYRNVRFSFRGHYWKALGVFVAMPTLVVISLGLLAPVASRLANNYIGSHTGYGNGRFHTDAPLRALYANLGASMLFAVAIAAMAALVLAVTATTGASNVRIFVGWYFFLILFSGLPALLLAYYFYRAGERNVAYGATRLDGQVALMSRLSRRRYVWILVSNLLASVATLGMLLPWASVRTWRYLADRTYVETPTDLDGFVDEQAPEGRVAAAEYLDIEGIDFGL